MGDIVVKDNVRYRKKDAKRADVVGTVQTKVPVADTDAWAAEQAEAARAALQAELDASRAKAEAALEAEIAGRRADLERELEQKRAASADAPKEEAAVPDSGEPVAAEQIDDDELATKVAEPDVKKVREPSTTKSRTSGDK
ncbi:MAG TPA: hypothetical protein VIP82_20765 [Microbacterium sp.]|uniref:hypothetical protein n=1 Tax=Microbacterium sp. TaxID=51671 RepID=UPI002F93025D